MTQLVFVGKMTMDGPRDTLLNEKFLVVRYYKMANCYPIKIHVGPGHDETEM